MFDPNLDATEVLPAFPASRFALLENVSQGGQGVVFRATAGDAHPFRSVGEISALKILVPGTQAERQEREVSALKALQCPSLSRLVDHGTLALRGADCLFLETEFIEGTSLQQRLLLGALSVPEVARIVHDVAVAIDAMWELGVVHRDIKPANIMIRPDGRPVLIDLGMARHTGRSSLTAQGFTLGTIGYLSPEQTRGVRQLSCKSDVYALGVTAVESLLGRHPTAHNQEQLTRKGLSKTAAIVPGAPKDFCQAIDSMLAARPIPRPIPEAVIADMRPFLVGEENAAT